MEVVEAVVDFVIGFYAHTPSVAFQVVVVVIVDLWGIGSMGTHNGTMEVSLGWVGEQYASS